MTPYPDGISVLRNSAFASWKILRAMFIFIYKEVSSATDETVKILEWQSVKGLRDGVRSLAMFEAA